MTRTLNASVSTKNKWMTNYIKRNTMIVKGVIDAKLECKVLSISKSYTKKMI